MDLPSTASPPTSRFRFFSEAGTLLAGPVEWSRALLAIDCPTGSLTGVTLERNGVALGLSQRVLDGSVQLVADWPLSGTGHYELKLRLSDQVLETSIFTIGPRKFSSQAYQDLLEELETKLPVTIALGLQKLGAATGLSLSPPTGMNSIAEEIARLRRAVTRTSAGPGLAMILRQVSQDPHQILADVEIWVPAERARRVEPAGLVQAVASGSNLDSNGIPLRLPDSRVQATFDVYENRLLKAFVDQVDHRLHRLRSALQDGDHTDHLAEVRGLHDQIRRARSQAPFLREVSKLGQAPTHLTMVLVKRPAYREMLETYLEFRRRTSVRLEAPALESPLESLPVLYEIWGVLQIIDSILELAVDYGYTVTKNELLRKNSMGAWIEVLPSGRPAVQLARSTDERIVSVIPQRTFSPVGLGLRSISYEQRPDLAIEVLQPGKPTEVYLLDPKYKLDSELSAEGPSDGKPKKVDIDKMHAYRDAIRDETESRVVRFAGILYPGPTREFAKGLVAISAVPGQEGKLREELKSTLSPALL